MAFEKKIELVEYVCPMVEKVQAQSKVLRKEKKCPEDLTKEVAAVIFLADYFSIPSFQRVKHQFNFKYGEKYIEKVCGKKKDVDEEIVKMVEYAPESKEIKERAKSVTEDCKKREKEEEKAKKEAEKAKKSGGSKKSKKHHKKDSSDDDSEEESEEESEESSEEEKEEEKEEKKEKKEESSSDSE